MLKAGFARVDMTPPFGMPVAGYYEARFADGVLDPLYLNALALNDGEGTLLIITVDVLFVRMDACDMLRALIAEKVGIPADHILINSLHQHTSVLIGGLTAERVQDAAYLDILYRKFVDVAQMAVNDLTEATLATAVQHATEDLSFVRRYFLKDGRLKTNPSPKSYPPEKLEGPAARADNDVRLVMFKREGAKDIVLVNFATHPDVVSGNKYSADWPGYVRKFVEAEHQDAHCILTNGFQGDTNHQDYMREGVEKMHGYQHCIKMGRVIADTVILMWDKTEPRESGRIFAEVRYVFNKTSTRGEEFYEECKRLSDRYRSGDYSIRKTESGIELTEACRIATIPEQPVYRKFPITVLGLGKIAFYGLGGEPFTEYGYIAREAFPDKFILTTTCTNGGEGYFPSAQAFSQGGYEVVSSHFTDTLEKTITDASLEMLGKF